MNHNKADSRKKHPGHSGLWAAIFPPYLIAVIIFPTLIGMFVNFQLIDFSEPFIIIAYATVLTLLRYLTGKNVFYYLAAILVFVNGFIMLVHWLMLKGPMSATSLFVVFNTNYDEAVSFFKLKNSASFFLIIPYVLLFVLALRYTFKIKGEHSRKNSWKLSVIALALLAFIGVKVGQNGMRAGTPLLARSSVLFYKEISAFEQLKRNSTKRVESIRAEALRLNNPQVTVLIQGESTNRNHLSLYGYYRDTSPYLTRFDSIIVFDNVVSAYTMTLESLSAELTEANLENDKKSYSSYNLMDVFRAADVKTYWLSNQSPLGVWDNVVTLLAQQSDVTSFVNVSGNSSLDSFTKTSYDSKLFGSLNAALRDTASRKFIVVHLMGSHATYSKRYPPEFDKFQGNSDKEKTIAAYDNSILYNDFVVDSLLKILRNYSEESNAVSAGIYLSDHGENVYDDGDNVGHDYTISAPKSIVEIPFFVWLSPVYQMTYPEKSRVIYEHHEDPFVTDDLFHAILDISNIHSDVLKNQRSIFSTEYNKDRKRVLADGEDYDEK